MSISCTTNIGGNNRAWLPPNFCASIYTDGLQKPRGLHIDSDHDEILLVKRGNSRVIRLDDDEKTVVTVASMSGLNHGIELAGGYLYASSSTTVYRWPYQSGQIMTANDNDRREVIVGMGGTTISSELGAPGGHKTRTLAFDDEGYLYVSIGSNGNVDADSFRSRIRRFDISAWDDATQPYIYNKGEVFADGLRNEVGMAFDSFMVIYGV